MNRETEVERSSIKNLKQTKVERSDPLALVCFDEEAEEFELWDSTAQSFLTDKEYKQHGDKESR